LTRLGVGHPDNNVKGRKILYRQQEVAEDPKNEIFTIF
jgi:hypothetical protein